MANILLVEDHPMVAQALAVLFANAGHEVTTVMSGLAAINAWSGTEYQLLYTDYRLGDMTAATLLSYLQRTGQPPGRVIVYSMQFDSKESIASYRRQLRAYAPASFLLLVPKGAEGEELLAMIEEALSA